MDEAHGERYHWEKKGGWTQTNKLRLNARCLPIAHQIFLSLKYDYHWCQHDIDSSSSTLQCCNLGSIRWVLHVLSHSMYSEVFGRTSGSLCTRRCSRKYSPGILPCLLCARSLHLYQLSPVALDCFEVCWHFWAFFSYLRAISNAACITCSQR